MDNPMQTGNSITDGVIMIFIWTMIGIHELFLYLGFIGWSDAPAIAAFLASVSFMVKNIWEVIDRKKQQKKRK